MFLADFIRAYAKVHEGPAALAGEAGKRSWSLRLGSRVDEFERSFNDRHLWLRLCWVMRRDLVLLAGIGVVAAILTPAVPWVLRDLLLAFETGRPTAGTAMALTALVLGRLLVRWYYAWHERRLTLLFHQVMQRAIFRRLQRSDFDALRERGREPLSYVSTYAMQLTQVVYVVDLAVTTLTIAVLSALLVAWFGILGIGVLMAIAALTWLLQRMIVVIGHIYYRYVDADHARVTLVNAVIAKVPGIRRQHLEPQVVTQLASARSSQLGILRQRARRQTSNRTLEYSVVPIISLLLVGLLVWSDGSVGGTTVFPLMLLVGFLLEAVANNLANYRVLRNSVGPGREVRRLFRDDLVDAVADRNLRPGELELRLPDGGTVSIGRGARVAVIGAEASSVLSAIACGSEAPVTARFGGEPALVGRNQPLFDGVLAELVVLWARPADRARYVAALKESGLATDLSDDDQGDMRLLSGREDRLSEGQAQRLALAQALYHQPDLLLLDDVFAPLDPELASAVCASVLSPCRDRPTRVFATTRLELVHHADEILLVGEQGAAVLVNADEMLAGMHRDTCERVLGPALSRLLSTQVSERPATQLRSGSELRYRFPDSPPPPAASTMDTTSGVDVRLGDVLQNARSLYTKPALAALTILLGVVTAAEIGFAYMIEEWPILGEPDHVAFAVLAGVGVTGVMAAAVRYLVTFSAPIASINRLHGLLVRSLLSGRHDSQVGRASITGRLTEDFTSLEMETPNRLVSLAAGVVHVAIYVFFVVMVTPTAVALLIPLAVAGAVSFRHGRRAVVAAARTRAAVRGPVLDFVTPALGCAGYRFSPVFRARLQARFDTLADLQATGGYWASLAQSRVHLSIEAVGLGLFLIVLWATVWRSAPTFIDAPGLLVFLALMLSTRLTGLLNELQGANVLLAQFERLAQLLGRSTLPPRCAQDEDGSTPDREYAALLESEPGKATADAAPLSVSDVGYVLPDGKALFSGLSLSVGPGEMVAIVGPSGVGKSTLVQIVGGTRRATGGTVLVDGLPPVANGSRTRSTLLHLDSDPVTLPITVRVLLDPFAEHDDERLRSILSELGFAAGLDARLPELDRPQRQLANLARVLLRPATLVVLDEATSALSSLQEESFLRLFRERTASAACLAVIHRRDNIDRFDRVISLNPEITTVR